jgi:PhnB protein
MSSINPYLNFSGVCEEAFEFYRSVFGGELDISRFAEMPGNETPEEDLNKVMHVSLPIGEDQVLMGSDRPSSMGPVTVGDSVQVSVAPSSSAEGKRIFEALSKGGEVTMPYQAMFWGAEFGSCTDRFGIDWMVNYEAGDTG